MLLEAYQGRAFLQALLQWMWCKRVETTAALSWTRTNTSDSNASTGRSSHLFDAVAVKVNIQDDAPLVTHTLHHPLHMVYGRVQICIAAGLQRINAPCNMPLSQRLEWSAQPTCMREISDASRALSAEHAAIFAWEARGCCCFRATYEWQLPQTFVRRFPLAVQVCASQPRAIIAHNDCRGHLHSH